MESFWEWVLPCEMKLSWSQRLAVYLVEHVPSPVIWVVLTAGCWKVAIWICSALLWVTRRPRVNSVRQLARGILRRFDTHLRSWRFPLVLSARLRPTASSGGATTRRRRSLPPSGDSPLGTPRGALAFYENVPWVEPRSPKAPLSHKGQKGTK